MRVQLVTLDVSLICINFCALTNLEYSMQVGTTDSVMGLPKSLTDRLIKEVL